MSVNSIQGSYGSNMSMPVPASFPIFNGPGSLLVGSMPPIFQPSSDVLKGFRSKNKGARAPTLKQLSDILQASSVISQGGSSVSSYQSNMFTDKSFSPATSLQTLRSPSIFSQSITDKFEEGGKGLKEVASIDVAAPTGFLWL